MLGHWEVTVVIEMVVASRMTGRCTRWERWLPGSGGGLKVLNRNLHSFQLLEIIQVLDSISWVRCASGNVYFVDCFHSIDYRIFFDYLNFFDFFKTALPP